MAHPHTSNPLGSPSFSPYPLCLPPRTAALRLKYIPMYLHPPRTAHPTSPSFLPRACSLSLPRSFSLSLTHSLLPLCCKSSSAIHESAHTHTCRRALSAVVRVHAANTARRDSTTFYRRQTERANGRKGGTWPEQRERSRRERAADRVTGGRRERAGRDATTATINPSHPVVKRWCAPRFAVRYVRLLFPHERE